MDVQTITMDREAARERLKAYRTSLHRRADAEYEAVAAGYEALAAGTPLIRLEDALRTAPRDEESRPMLAVARADRRQVRVRWERTLVTFDCTKDFRQSVQHGSLLIYSLNMRELCGRKTTWGSFYTEGFALVPMVPPEALEAAGGTARLREHLILWEVEEWADALIGAQPDLDPMLLRPLGGDLYAVVAHWDLTDLERAVMAGRVL